MGRLGCNGRACHGSFQGKGGFRLSLFGYDFEADHKALTEEVGDEGSVRVNRETPEESLIIAKPTNEDIHEGGQRYEKGSWEHHLLRRWIESGAEFSKEEITPLERLEITPSEIQFQKAGQTVQLRAVAVWKDGTKEDVTPLCRFQTNNEQTATVTESGLVTAVDPGDTHVVVFYDNGVTPIPVIRPVSNLAGDQYPKVAAPTPVDELVIEKLRKLGVVPSEIAGDAEFLRRVKLDLTGTLPTPAEVQKFLADASPDKRARKIDELLESPAYAAWWTTKLCDFTGNNDNELRNTGPVRGRPSQDWFDWIYARVAENVPYDELMEGIVLGQSRNPGESYREYCETMSDIYRGEGEFADRESMPFYWARNNIRQTEDKAIAFAYSFMGIRIQCAQCHKHPFDQWTKDDFDQFTGFFSRISPSRGPSPESRDEYDDMLKKLGVKGQRGNQLQRALPDLLKKGETVPFPEIYAMAPRRGGNNRRNRNAPADTAKLLGEPEAINLNEHADARKPLMDWLRREDNPFFAKAFVNRVWANYFNVGIVEPPDDLSLANPPSNAALLDHLARGFIESGFDMKWVHREILGSDAYQRSWVANDTNASDVRNFSHAVPRRLPAEAVYDAVVQATASDSVVEQMQTDLEDRAVAMAGAGPRNNNNGANFALSVFGRSIRESNCDCDRSMEPSLLQTVFLQNDRDVLTMIDRRDGWVTQVARESGGRNPAAADERPANYERQVVALERRLRQLKKASNDDAAGRIETRLAQLKRRFGGDRPEKAASNLGSSGFEPKSVVEQAYLRTVSRYPREDELARSTEYLTSYEDPLDGVRGLLWALINTKEFIVNH
ncbi:MAG: DUF1549 domain-containing protein [Planctomycetes bacterium]|nr:DUF1549 domain-containing protein [Planctomycetota bacterium]